MPHRSGERSDPCGYLQHLFSFTDRSAELEVRQILLADSVLYTYYTEMGCALLDTFHENKTFLHLEVVERELYVFIQTPIDEEEALARIEKFERDWVERYALLFAGIRLRVGSHYGWDSRPPTTSEGGNS